MFICVLPKILLVNDHSYLNIVQQTYKDIYGVDNFYFLILFNFWEVLSF